MIGDILAVLLIGVLPVRALYKSVWRKNEETSRPKIYIRTVAIIGGLLVVLCYAWVRAAHSPAALGLDIPLSERGAVGLLIAAALVVALAIAEIVAKRTRQASSDEKARKKLANDDFLPRTGYELRLFLGLALLVGCGWELLYRGFLVWFLVPHVGTTGAVCVASFAYAAAHGYKGRGQFLGSLISAFAFTIAFVLTDSLWWLMLIHTGTGVAGGFASYKLASRCDGNASLGSEKAVCP